ncbi:uncharacterized protein N7459_005732 [Penicillium hispanicum]|uniref:uncharacterized protein n=1 Tax=Penicillium hispanicum TaxID=1080232 RepID=UPI00253FD685|nr:uncharacterized protein N7459_005732 [Penicillium hispanicum]KAJ5579747.1 hypothetical protein N7459_005732 [Penicillium hispanicum]
MPRAGRATSGSHELRACTECRKRKSKCSGSSPCTYCERTGKACVFGHTPSRTPLTRRNLDATEARCAALQSIIHRISPDLDIEAALSRAEGILEAGSTASLEASHGLDSEAESTNLSGDRFEWREASLTSPSGPQKSPLDGMASLPSERTESGYLGDSAGTAILRTISELIPADTSSPNDQHENASPTNTNQTRSPALLINFANVAALDGLVDAYFMWYNPSYPVLHERTFREKYQIRHQIHPASSWHPMFFLVFAIGHWILTEDSEAEQSVYYTAARSRMSMRMLESGTLLNVQVFLLMGNYLQKRDRPNTGYNFLGIAYRMALGLGLHREPPGGATHDTLHNERRRVVWWIVYCFDSGLSLTTGRPLTVSDSFIETHLPRNIDDADCTLDSYLPPPVDQPTIYSAIIAQARLASIGNVVFSELISSSNKRSWDLKNSRSIDYRFKAWKLSLPAYFTAQEVPNWFRGPRAIVIWKEQNLRMMLWWGSQRVCSLPSDKQEAQNLCHFTAIETIQEITNFSHNNPNLLHTGLGWYATYFLFQAALVLSIHHLRSSQPLGTDSIEVAQELWLSSISRSRECLASLSSHNKAASRCLAVLDRIRNHSQPSRETSASSASPANPPTDFSQRHTTSERPAPLAVDPTLQMFFEDSTWDHGIFQGLNGFPGTVGFDKPPVAKRTLAALAYPTCAELQRKGKSNYAKVSRIVPKGSQVWWDNPFVCVDATSLNAKNMQSQRDTWESAMGMVDVKPEDITRMIDHDVSWNPSWSQWANCEMIVPKILEILDSLAEEDAVGANFQFAEQKQFIFTSSNVWPGNYQGLQTLFDAADGDVSEQDIATWVSEGPIWFAYVMDAARRGEPGLPGTQDMTWEVDAMFLDIPTSTIDMVAPCISGIDRSKDQWFKASSTVSPQSYYYLLGTNEGKFITTMLTRPAFLAFSFQEPTIFINANTKKMIFHFEGD